MSLLGIVQTEAHRDSKYIGNELGPKTPIHLCFIYTAINLTAECKDDLSFTSGAI